MKRLIYAMLMIFCISNVCIAEDYIKLDIESVAANTTVDIPFLIQRTCPDPTYITGASNGFEISATGDASWTWVDHGAYPGWEDGTGYWNLTNGLIFALTDVDGYSPDYFLTSGAGLPPAGGMPIIEDDMPYFWIRLAVGTGDGEICFDSAYIEPAGVWKWTDLTCGVGEDPERPLFVDYNGNDVNPICVPVEHVCNPPVITGKPIDDELTTSHCSGAAWTFTADPGDYDGVPATPLTWAVTSGPGLMSPSGEYTCGSFPVGSHQVDIEVTNSCGMTDAYTFLVTFTSSNPQFTNCDEVPTKIAGGENYDFLFTTDEPCDDLHFTIANSDPSLSHPPTIGYLTGDFHWETDATDINVSPYFFSIRVEETGKPAAYCDFSVLVVDPPDFYLKDCELDYGSTVPSPCDPFWDYEVDHAVENMVAGHGRKLLMNDWNTIITKVHNRGGSGDGFPSDNTARLFAYWMECAGDIFWPVPELWYGKYRITHDPHREFGDPAVNYVEAVVYPGYEKSVSWEWLAPSEEELSWPAPHICIGYVINPTTEAEGMTSPTIDYDRTEGRFPPVDHNNVAQINLVPITRSTDKKSKGTAHVEELSIPIWNFSDEPITVIPQLRIITLGYDWSVAIYQTDSLYIPSDTCEFVDFDVTIPAQAPHTDSSIIDFLAIDPEQNQTIGGVRFEIRVDNEAPDPVMLLETLCADFMPDCCLWLPPEICSEMGAKAPLQWEIPDYDVANCIERVWFFIVCRSGSPDVGLDDQIDSVAADLNLEDPEFQWFDHNIEIGDTYYYCVYAVDEAGNMSARSNVVEYGPYICGDADGSGAIDIDDVVFLIAYIFSEGPEPNPLEAGDATCDLQIDIDDVVHLISYIFSAGPAPCSECDEPGNFSKDAIGSAEVRLAHRNENSESVVDVSILSNSEVQGIQLEFAIDGTVNNLEAACVIDGLDIFQGRSGDRFRVGLVDLQGRHMIPSDNSSALNIAYSGDGQLLLEDRIIVARGGGKMSSSVMKQTDQHALPTGYVLEQNCPNPFNPTTEISFSMPEPSDVTLAVYNIAGQRVATLVDRHLQAGTHSVTWDGHSRDREPVATGIYFYRIEASEFRETRKMLLLK